MVGLSQSRSRLSRLPSRKRLAGSLDFARVEQRHFAVGRHWPRRHIRVGFDPHRRALFLAVDVEDYAVNAGRQLLERAKGPAATLTAAATATLARAAAAL